MCIVSTKERNAVVNIPAASPVGPTRELWCLADLGSIRSHTKPTRGTPSQSSTLVQPRIAAVNTMSSATVSCTDHAVSYCAYKVRQTLNNTRLLDNEMIAVGYSSGSHCRLGMTLGID